MDHYFSAVITNIDTAVCMQRRFLAHDFELWPALVSEQSNLNGKSIMIIKSICSYQAVKYVPNNN